MTTSVTSLLTRAAAGDHSAIADLLMAWSPRIASLARSCARPGIGQRDLEAAAVEGLLIGLRRYDPARGGGWSYLSTFARKAMYAHARGSLPGVAMAESAYTRDGAPLTASMDSSGEDGQGLHELMAASSWDIGAAMDDIRMSRGLVIALGKVTPRQAAIVRLLFGLDGQPAYQPREVSPEVWRGLVAVETYARINSVRPRRADALRGKRGRFRCNTARNLQTLALDAIRAHPRRRNQMHSVLRTRRAVALQTVASLERRGLVVVRDGVLTARCHDSEPRRTSPPQLALF